MGTHPIFESDFDCLTECCPCCKKEPIGLTGTWPVGGTLISTGNTRPNEFFKSFLFSLEPSDSSTDMSLSQCRIQWSSSEAVLLSVPSLPSHHGHFFDPKKKILNGKLSWTKITSYCTLPGKRNLNKPKPVSSLSPISKHTWNFYTLKMGTMKNANFPKFWDRFFYKNVNLHFSCHFRWCKKNPRKYLYSSL